MIAKIKNYLQANEQVKYLIILIVVFILAIALTNPIGEFALNDDWFYYDTVRQFNFNDFQLDKWVAPALMGQVFYAKIITTIFGFSFSILRLATLFLALLGIIFLYKLFVSLDLTPKKSFWLSLLFLFNPIFYNLGFSFMTDIPALSLIIIALYFYRQGLYQEKDYYLSIANFLTIYASLIRQNYILFLLIFALVFLWDQRKNLTLDRIIKITVVPLGLFAIIYLFFNQIGWWPQSSYNTHSFEKINHLLTNARGELYSAWQYLGLVLLPISLGWLIRTSKKNKIIGLLAAIITTGLSLILYLITKEGWPYSGNIISIYGLGARDPNGVLAGTPNVIIGPNITIVLTILASLGAGLLLIMLFLSIQEKLQFKDNKSFCIFITLNLVAQWLVIMLVISFDRYYLILEILLLVILASLIKKIKINLVSIILIIILAIISIGGTYNYLRENQLKWSIANHLVVSGIQPSSIDAGYEWLGWNWYHQVNPEILPFYDPTRTWYTTKIFPDNTREYIISFSSQKDNYILVEKQKCKKFLWGKGSLYLLKYQPKNTAL